MPPGAPFQSFILPYTIRVDNFATSVSQDNAAALHLLTHTHTDHINGLSSPSFGYKVVCSVDAKVMLLKHEVYGERELYEQNMRAQKTRTFSHLKIAPLVQPDGTLFYPGSRDLLDTIPLHYPRTFELSDSESVNITALDANHCPGAVMFLVEGAQANILHTGDFRAEPWFLESLTRNPFLQPYLAQHDDDYIPNTSAAKQKEGMGVAKTLDAIYLDTACVLSTMDVPTKERATRGLVELMKFLPHTSYFFINAWTWGYEDILKAVARGFNCKIHVDRYKHGVLSSLSDPFLREIITTDATATRFHACERFDRCSYVACDDRPSLDKQAREYNYISQKGKHVVYVNPVTMDEGTWDEYLRETKVKLLNGERVNNLLVPLSRHSPLVELRKFVSLFRPWRVVPNTLDPQLGGLDWLAINRVFEGCLHPLAGSSHDPTISRNLIPQPTLDYEVLGSRLRLEKKEEREEGDIALSNLVGEGAHEVAGRWSGKGETRGKGGKGKMELLEANLEGDEVGILYKLFGVRRRHKVERNTTGHNTVVATEVVKASRKEVQSQAKAKVKSEPSVEAVVLSSSPPRPLPSTSTTRAKGKPRAAHVVEVHTDIDSEDASGDDSSGDERGRTAHLLFAEMSGLEQEDIDGRKWWINSSPNGSVSVVSQGAEQVVVSETSLHAVAVTVAVPASVGKRPVTQWNRNMLATPVSSPLKPMPVGYQQQRGMDSVPPTPALVHSRVRRDHYLLPSSSKKRILPNDTPPPIASTSIIPVPPLPFTPISGPRVKLIESAVQNVGPLASPIRLAERGTSSAVKNPNKGKQKAPELERLLAEEEEEVVLVAHNKPTRTSPSRNKPLKKSRPKEKQAGVDSLLAKKGQPVTGATHNKSGRVVIEVGSSPILVANPPQPPAVVGTRQEGEAQELEDVVVFGYNEPMKCSQLWKPAKTTKDGVEAQEGRPKKRARVEVSTPVNVPLISTSSNQRPVGKSVKPDCRTFSKPTAYDRPLPSSSTPISSQPLVEISNFERAEFVQGSSALRLKNSGVLPEKDAASGSQFFEPNDILSSTTFHQGKGDKVTLARRSSLLSMGHGRDFAPHSTSRSFRSPRDEERSRIIREERRKQRAEMNSTRLKIGERLAKARPDLVHDDYERKRARLVKREVRYRLGDNSRTGNKEDEGDDCRTVYDEGETKEGVGMDWERSRFIADGIRDAVSRGQRPEVPDLLCAKSQ